MRHLFKNIYLFSFAGIPVYTQYNVLILILLVIFPDFDLLSIFLAIGLLIYIFLHELGHALCAKFLQINVESINLFALGGYASIDMSNTSANERIAIAIAGPIINFIIFILGLFAHIFLSSTEIVRADNLYVISIWVTNLLLLCQNLIPVHPLDGGRIVRELLCKVLSRVTSIRASASLSILVSLVAIFSAVIYGGISISSVAIVLMSLFFISINLSELYIISREETMNDGVL